MDEPCKCNLWKGRHVPEARARGAHPAWGTQANYVRTIYIDFLASPGPSLITWSRPRMCSILVAPLAVRNQTNAGACSRIWACTILLERRGRGGPKDRRNKPYVKQLGASRPANGST